MCAESPITHGSQRFGRLEASRVLPTLAVSRLGARGPLETVIDRFALPPLNAAPMQGAQQVIATAQVRL